VQPVIAEVVPASRDSSASRLSAIRSLGGGESQQTLVLRYNLISMKIIKIILGIIVIALGLGMTAAGWAIFMYGQWPFILNLFFGFTLGFIGIGLTWPGAMLMRGSTVRHTLGGAVSALQGHGGVGLNKGDIYYVAPANIKQLVFDILKYAVIAICVILIAIFSIFRVIGGLPIGT
jgi:hypothetical protein